MSTRLLLALTGSALESSVITALQHPARPDVQIVRRCVDVSDLVAAACTGRARAALLSPDLPHLDADVVAALRRADVEPVGVVSGEPGQQTHRLHQIGIRIVLAASDADDLADRLLESLRRSDEDDSCPAASSAPTAPAAPPVDGPGGRPQPPEQPGRVVAVWGPTGAPGRSTLALGVAAELAGFGLPALLVDADVYGGSVAQHLGMLDDVSGLLAAARNAKVGTLDTAALATHCRSIGDLRVLTGLPRADRWPEVSPAVMSAVLAAARSLASHVVVDCGFSLESDDDLLLDTAAPRRNGATWAVLEAADLVLAVGSADPVGLTRLARGVVDLTAALPACEVGVVVNRMRPGLGWSAGEATAVLERFTGRGAASVLPEDRAACDRALARGRTLTECARSSPLRAALRDLAADLAGVDVTRARRRPRPRVPA